MFKRSIFFLVILLSFNSCIIGTAIHSVSVLKKSQKAILLPESPISDTIPFRINSRNWMILNVKVSTKIDTSDYNFMFDSGASTCLLDSSLKEDLYVRAVNNTLPLKVATANGSYQDSIKTARKVIIGIGKTKFMFEHLLSSPTKIKIDGDIIHGIIGPNIINKSRTLIDFENNKIITNVSKPPRNWYNTSFTTTGQAKSPVIKSLKICDSCAVDWFIDTGNPGDLIMKKTNLNNIKNMFPESQLFQIALAYRGKDAAGILLDSMRYQMNGNSINGILSNKFNIFIIKSNIVKDKRPNNMGLGFMRKVFSKIIIDYIDMKIYYMLKPVDYSVQDLLSKDITFNTTLNVIYVSSISTESSWFKQGLRADYSVTAINGKPASYWLQHLDDFQKIEYESFEYNNGLETKILYK